VDYDVREALDAAIRTRRTLQSGLLYESRPANPLAAELADELRDAVERFREEEAAQTGIHKTRDVTILGILVFLQHLERSHNNGRRRGRAFLDLLGEFYVAASPDSPPPTSPLILP
jgi:hypothetical protein